MISTLPLLPPRHGSVKNAWGKDPRLDQAVEWWNQISLEFALGRVIKITGTRARHVFARLQEEEFSLPELRSHIAKSSFLRGTNARGWKMDFDWLFGSPQNYLKVLEGKYDDRPGTNRESAGGREIFTPDSVQRVASIARKISEARNGGGDLKRGAGG